MKLIKESPLFFILICTSIIYAALYMGQYAGQKEENTIDDLTGYETESDDSTLSDNTEDEQEIEKAETVSGNSINETVSGNMSMQETVSGNDLPEETVSGNNQTSQVVETDEPEFEEILPIRETTQEEYLNHISADIYGDEGKKRAAEYEFVTVDEAWFDDALFIGDSRTVGLHDYTTLSEHADFLCETSLTIHKVLKHNFKGYGTIEDVLAAKEYGKIYISVGINELGTGTTEMYMEEYTRVVETLHELEPNAKIIIQGIMFVSEKKSNEDKIFNNSNILARNNAIATLADNQQIFYIDVNEAVCDENGHLTEEYTYDQIHLLGRYNDLWKDYLLKHGIK